MQSSILKSKARGAPQVGFSAIIRKISSRTSVDSFFLPTGFPAFEIKLQYSLKTSAMPVHDCLRIDEHQRLLPSTPKTTGEYPEDFVNRSNPGSGMLALQHGQLLPEGEIFQEQASMRLQAAGEQAQP